MSGSIRASLEIMKCFQWRCAIGFFSALFGGSSPELNKNISEYGQVGGWATGQGQADVGKSSKFWSDILSGDSSKISQSLAPQIGAAKSSAQQENKTRSEFGNRSGGTAASNAMTSDKTHSDITSLIGSLTGSSASNLGSIGESMLSTGLGALNMQDKAVQQRMSNWQNSILGKGITGAVQAGESFATGGFGGMATGGSFLKGGAGALSGGGFFG